MECMFGRTETSDRIHQFKSWLHFVHKVSADFKIKFQFYQQGGRRGPVMLSQRDGVSLGKMDLAAL